MDYRDESENEHEIDDIDDVSNCSIEAELSFTAPSFSPCVIDKVAEIIPTSHTDVESVTSSHTQTGSLLNSNSEEDCQGHGTSTGKRNWKGYKLVADNTEKNIRPSFQRYNNKTKSLHYFHYYALLDRVDLSTCLESLPTIPVNLKQLLVCQDDIQKLESDAIVLFSRCVSAFMRISILCCCDLKCII